LQSGPEAFASLSIFFIFLSKGVTSSMLYFGLKKTGFPLHAEDSDLPSLNYLHAGAAKLWVVARPEDTERIKKLVDVMVPTECSDQLRHKNLLLSPRVLSENCIPYDVLVQQPGEFVMVFPNALHQGWNLGPNLAEAANFGSNDWVAHWRSQSSAERKCICVDEKNQALTLNLDMSHYPPEASR
jgi:jumonji domain-containing protein 2